MNNRKPQQIFRADISGWAHSTTPFVRPLDMRLRPGLPSTPVRDRDALPVATVGPSKHNDSPMVMPYETPARRAECDVDRTLEICDAMNRRLGLLK